MSAKFLEEHSKYRKSHRERQHERVIFDAVKAVAPLLFIVLQSCPRDLLVLTMCGNRGNVQLLSFPD